MRACSLCFGENSSGGIQGGCGCGLVIELSYPSGITGFAGVFRNLEWLDIARARY
jgi:hypothetical protein